MPVPWRFYRNKRKLKLPRWFRLNKIKSYEDLLLFLNTSDVNPPSREEVAEYFVDNGAPQKSQKLSSSSKKEVFGTSKIIVPEKKLPRSKTPSKRRRSVSKKGRTKSGNSKKNSSTSS